MISSSTQNRYQMNVPSSFYNYNVLKNIGSGSSCIVALIENKKSHAQYSAKIISKKHAINLNILQLIYNEIKILKSLNHPNIIKFYESFEIKNDSQEELIVVITEYCSKGDLLTYFDNHYIDNQTTKMNIFHGVLSAIKYLHDKGIAHGDIKSENILLDSNYNAKLCDFGFSQTKIIQDNEDFKRGTLFYAAPELFHPGKFNTLKTDIYSIGIMLYSLDQLEFPVKDGDESFIKAQISKGKLKFKKNIDHNLLSLVLRCTNIDANKRPKIEDIINDDYFVDGFNYQNKKSIKFESNVLFEELNQNSKENNLIDIIQKKTNYSKDIENQLISYIMENKEKTQNFDFICNYHKENDLKNNNIKIKSKLNEMFLFSYVLKSNNNKINKDKMKKLKMQLILKMIDQNIDTNKINNFNIFKLSIC